MRTEFKDTPRVFLGGGNRVEDMGKIHLEPGEMVSFVYHEGGECDFYAMPWGYYLGPSVNSRLKNEGFKTALVMNRPGQLYLNAVHKSKIDMFLEYLRTNDMGSRLICWLDEFFPGEENVK